MPQRPSSPVQRPRSPPRPRSPTTSTFQIRGLPSLTPGHEAGSVTVSSSEYDSLVSQHPEAVLCYIDEDDEEVIRVGSGAELRSRWLEVMGFPPPPPPIIFNVEGGSKGLQHWQRIFQQAQPEASRVEQPKPVDVQERQEVVEEEEEQRPSLPPRPVTVVEESEEEESLYAAPPAPPTKRVAPEVPPKEEIAESSRTTAPRQSETLSPLRIPVEFASEPFVASFEAEINRIYDEVVSQAGGSPRCLSPRPMSPPPPLSLNTQLDENSDAPNQQNQIPEDFPRTPVELITDVFSTVIQSIQRVAQEATTQAARAFPHTPNGEGRNSPAETLDAFNIAVQQLLKNFTDQLHTLATEAVVSAGNPRANPQHPAAVIRTFAETVGHAAVQNAGRVREGVRGVGSDAGVEARKAAEEIKKAAEEVKKAAQIVGHEVGRRGSAIGQGVGQGVGSATREVGKVFSNGAGIVTGFAGGLVRNLSGQSNAPAQSPAPELPSEASRPEDAPEVVQEPRTLLPEAVPEAVPEATETATAEHPVPGSFPATPPTLIIPPMPNCQLPLAPQPGYIPCPPPQQGELVQPPPPPPPPPVPGFELPPPPPPHHGKHMPPHHGFPPMPFHHYPPPPPPPPPGLFPPPHHHHFHHPPPPPPPLPIPYHPVDLHFHHPPAHPPSHTPGWHHGRSGGAWSGFGRIDDNSSAQNFGSEGEHVHNFGLHDTFAGMGINDIKGKETESSETSSSSDSERDYKVRKGPFRHRGIYRGGDRSRRRRRSQESAHFSDSSFSGDRSWKKPYRRSPPKAMDSPFENPWCTTLKPPSQGDAFNVPRDFKPVPPPKPFHGFPHQFPPPPPQFFPPLPSFPTNPPSPVPELDNCLPPLASVVPGFGGGSSPLLDRRHSSYIPLDTTSGVSDSESEDDWKDTKEKMDGVPEVPEHEKVNLVDLESSVSSLASKLPIPESMRHNTPLFPGQGLRRSRTTTDSFGKHQPWLQPWQRRMNDSIDAESSEAMKRFPSLSELQRDWHEPYRPPPPSQPVQPPQLPSMATSSPFDDFSSLASALPPISTIKVNNGPSNPFTNISSAAPAAPLPGAWPFAPAPPAPLVDTSDSVSIITGATAGSAGKQPLPNPRPNSRNPFLTHQVDTTFTPPANYNFPPLPGNLHRATSMSNASTRSRQSSTSTVRFAEPLVPRRAHTVLVSSTRNNHHSGRLSSPFSAMPGHFPEEPLLVPQPQTSQSAIEEALARERERMRLIEEVEESVRRSSEEFEEQQRINAASLVTAVANSRIPIAGSNNRSVTWDDDPIDKCVQSLIEMGYTELGTDRLRVFSEMSGGRVEEAVEMLEDERGAWQTFTR
ncbi:hypothetical protein H072_10646 [Dactylellina haptotyla CBS 200.50]|uniref:Uncharacterized protein n=1 Tax=Dactylellina haptotyla (strain CBS 200.50) TaxID=1284197 RepID=S8B9Y7_DACHA|nr:hypothetical protein H072_10646 [Dactylellina haptotyla CBS 200.50]